VSAVTRRSVRLGPPADHIDGEFPGGRLRAGAPVAAAYAQAVARALVGALVGRNISEVCTQAGLSRSTVYDLLTGRTWPDMVTLAHLEATLGVRLWPLEPPPVG
jgi:hypothetical protein